MAVYGTWCAVRLDFKPHLITTFALMAYLAGCFGLAIGDRSGFVLGVTLLWVGYWLDHVDGQVARWQGRASLTGTAFDYWMHHAVNLTIGFALGYGMAQRTGQMTWVLAGFASGSGWLLLALHDDCHYKAFFQRLKHTTSCYHVTGRAGVIGHFSRRQSVSLPRRMGRAGYVMCEHPNVLIMLCALCITSLLAPSLGSIVFALWLLVMGFLAPMLATARLIQRLRDQSADRDFTRWFQLDREGLGIGTRHEQRSDAA
jgi:hypothetical protein